MAAPHQNHSQSHIVSGANGSNGGGDDFVQPHPSTSGEEAEQTMPSFQAVCLRWLSLCRYLLHRLARRFSEQLLPVQSLVAVYDELTDVHHTATAASVAAYEPHPRKWYIVTPISVVLRATSTGVDLVERYLDIRLPENQHLGNWLRERLARLKDMEKRASSLPDSDVIPKEPAHPDTPGHQIIHFSVEQLKEQEEAIKSIVKDDDKQENTEETEEKSEEKMEEGKEPAQPETPGDQSMYFSVEQLKEQEEAIKSIVKDDKQENTEKIEEKSEEKMEEGKEPAQPETPGDQGMYFSAEQLEEQEEAVASILQDDDKRQKAEETEEKSEEKMEEGKEPAQPETPGDQGMYFSAEKLKEQEEAVASILKDDDKQEKAEETEEKSEEKMEEGKVERPATAAEDVGGASVDTEQPQPEPQPPAATPAECLVSVQEAERAIMSALGTPSAQPASSQDFLAAEGPSQPKPGPIRTARRPAKVARFFNLFGSKKD